MKNIFLILLLFLLLSCSATGRNNALQTTLVVAGTATGSIFGPPGAMAGAAIADMAGEVFFPDPVEPIRTDNFSGSLKEIMTPKPQNWLQGLINTFIRWTFYGVALIFLVPFLFKKGRAYIKSKLQAMVTKLSTNKFSTKYRKKLNKRESKKDSDNF